MALKQQYLVALASNDTGVSFIAGSKISSVLDCGGTAPTGFITPKNWTPCTLTFLTNKIPDGNQFVGEVLSVSIENRGNAYTSAPAVDFSAGDGTGAAGIAVLGYALAGVTITSPGSYKSMPVLGATIGTGAVITSLMALQHATVIDGGGTYSVGNTIIVPGGTQVGSTNSNYATLQVTAVTSDLGIAAVSVSRAGEYSALPSSPMADQDYYPAVYAASTVNIPCIYAAGPDGANPGVGATLTSSFAINNFFVDGLFIPRLARVLIKDQTPNSEQNGIYVLTNIGSESVPFVLTRDTSQDTSNEFVQFGSVSVENGNLQAGSLWQVTSSKPLTIGTSAIVFAEFYGRNATFDLDSWGLIAATVVSGGQDYESTSTLTISDDAGSGGAGTLSFASTGQVKAVNLTNPGTGYSTGFDLAFTGGGGTGAAATAIVAPSGSFSKFSNFDGTIFSIPTVAGQHVPFQPAQLNSVSYLQATCDTAQANACILDFTLAPIFQGIHG